MKTLGVIPARFASTRFPGKPLAPILGKPMILWVCEGAQKSQLLNELVVATDDERIAKVVRDAGFSAVMTDSNLTTGTDRIFQAMQKTKLPALGRWDWILNLQGDEPLLSGAEVDALVETAAKHKEAQMVTLGVPFESEKQISQPDIVKVLVNDLGLATYFSRFAVPFSRESSANGRAQKCVFRHLGLYGYRADFLQEFCTWPQGEWEQAESLEQLRALQKGAAIAVKIISADLASVDRPEDLVLVEKKLLEKNARGPRE